jgi:RNA polymerase sigma-70 factor (ECF subfamily)
LGAATFSLPEARRQRVEGQETAVLQLRRRGPATNPTTPAVAADCADPAEFARLYDVYADPVLNYCYYRLGDWSDAEDAAQQVFAQAFAAWPRFQPDAGSVRSWLFTIAHHEVADRWRRRSRRPTLPLDAVGERADAGPTPEELAIAADHQGRVRALLLDLSDDQRRVIELRLAGLSDGEIGRILGRSPGAVRAVQARGVQRLRLLLGLGDGRNGGGDG